MKTQLNAIPPNRPRQAPRDTRLEQCLNWIEAEISRLHGNWIPKLGHQLAEANYATFRQLGHPDWRFEAWRICQIAAEVLADLEKRRKS